MTDSSARLVVQGGAALRQEFPLSAQTLTLGRESINDIFLDDPEVSRRHATITFQTGRYVLEDVGSTNGTFVNGRRISTPVALSDGDVITLGESVSLVFYGPADLAGETVIEASLDRPGDATILEPSGFSQPVQEPAQSPLPKPQYSAEPEAPVAASTPYVPPSQPAEAPQSGYSRRRIAIGCGCLLFLAVVACGAALFLLDSYNNGVLLYCGPARPLWEIIFGAGDIAATCAAA